MNMFKKNGGFTLVELIVVIAILAILAAVAIPAYSGYITKANDAADITALGAVKTACMGAMAKTATVEQVTVTADATTGAITKVIANTTVMFEKGTNEDTWNADFAMYINNTLPVLKGSFKTAAGAVWATGADWVPAPAQN